MTDYWNKSFPLIYPGRPWRKIKHALPPLVAIEARSLCWGKEVSVANSADCSAGVDRTKAFSGLAASLCVLYCKLFRSWSRRRGKE